MSKKNKFILTIGIIIVLMPLLGFPGAARDTIIILSGLALIGGVLWGHEWSKGAELFLNRHWPRHYRNTTFSENTPPAMIGETYSAAEQSKRKKFARVGDGVEPPIDGSTAPLEGKE